MVKFILTATFLALFCLDASLAAIRQKSHDNLQNNPDVDDSAVNDQNAQVTSTSGLRAGSELRLLQADVSGAKTPSTTRVFVQYQNDRGRKFVLQHARKIFHDFSQDRWFSIEADNILLKRLQAHKSIVSVQNDTVWTEAGFLEEVIDPDNVDEYVVNNPDKFHRHLSQSTPYGISMVQADQISYGRNTAAVCIVDTGANKDHPDFDSTKISGANRVSNVDGATLYWSIDNRGHGTHVAGTVAARNNNDFVRGIGAIPLYITRGLSDLGQAFESDIREALQQCDRAEGVRVVSLSLSGGSMSSALTAVIDQLYANGKLIVAASGNDGGKNANYPAAYAKVLSVGAVSSDENIWSASNYGSALELAGPGVGIVSLGYTYNGVPTLSTYSGTSMATPHIAGAAAILMSHFPSCTPTQIRYALAYTAKDKGSPGCDSYYGYGIPQIKNAYNFLAIRSCRNAKWGKSLGDGSCDLS